MIHVGLVSVMTLHRTESLGENGTSLDFLPIVKHIAVLDRALDLLCAPDNDFLLISRD